MSVTIYNDDDDVEMLKAITAIAFWRWYRTFLPVQAKNGEWLNNDAYGISRNT